MLNSSVSNLLILPIMQSANLSVNLSTALSKEFFTYQQLPFYVHSMDHFGSKNMYSRLSLMRMPMPKLEDLCFLNSSY